MRCLPSAIPLRVSHKLHNNGLSHTCKTSHQNGSLCFILLTHPRCKIDFTTKYECEVKQQTASSWRWPITTSYFNVTLTRSDVKLSQWQILAPTLTHFRANSTLQVTLSWWLNTKCCHSPDIVLLRRFLLPNQVHRSCLDRLLFSETHKRRKRWLAHLYSNFRLASVNFIVFLHLVRLSTFKLLIHNERLANTVSQRHISSVDSMSVTPLCQY